nr:hypothetical protein [Bacillus amyloliquefaciens]MDH3087692.1 hypothetical protein [Bacillus amyloliquefaciens]
MSQDLKIILTPKADTSSKTVEQLNQQIKSLEKKLNSLNLKTNIDASALKTLNDFSSAVDTYPKHLKSFNQTVKETTTITRNADGTVEKLTQQYKKNGEIILEEMEKRNAPPINITLDVVNFFNCLSESHNWDRCSLGDTVRIRSEELKTDVKARLVTFNFDFAQKTMDVTISNGKKIKSDFETISNMMYTSIKTNMDYNKRKIDWENATENFNIRNDRIAVKPDPPIIAKDGTAISHTTNDDGSVDITIEWDYPTSDEDKLRIR